MMCISESVLCFYLRMLISIAVLTWLIDCWYSNYYYGVQKNYGSIPSWMIVHEECFSHSSVGIVIRYGDLCDLWIWRLGVPRSIITGIRGMFDVRILFELSGGTSCTITMCCECAYMWGSNPCASTGATIHDHENVWAITSLEFTIKL